MTFDYNCWRMILNEYFRQLELAIVSDTVLHNIAGMFGKDGPQRTTVQRWVNAFENHGDIGPRRERTKKFWTRIVPVHLDLARVLFQQHPTAYYHEICFGIFTVYGILYSREQLCEALNAAGLTRKVIIIFFIYSILLKMPFMRCA